MNLTSYEDFSLTKKGSYKILMRCFVLDYAQFGGREVLSLNSCYEINSSHCEETSGLFADLGIFLFWM